MRTFIGAGIPAVLLGSLVLMAQAPASSATGRSQTPVFWSARQMTDLSTQAGTRVSPDTHMAGETLACIRDDDLSGGEIQAPKLHEKLADFIFVREGEGVILIGGRMIGGKPSGADEIRGDSIEGGTRYPVAAGDTIYVPANMPHQFFVEKGKHWVITIVKITPKP